MSVGFGIVGSGLMAGVYANALADDTTNTRFVGVTAGTRAPGLAARYGVEHIPTYEDMLARPDVDAVILATPHSVHLPETVAAAAAGKHVLVEKPMGLDRTECRRMIDACRAAGVLLTVGQVTRRMEASRVARRMIDEGDIGDVRMIQTWRGLAGGWGVPLDSLGGRPEGGRLVPGLGIARLRHRPLVRRRRARAGVRAGRQVRPEGALLGHDVRPVHVRERRHGPHLDDLRAPAFGAWRHGRATSSSARRRSSTSPRTAR